MTRTELVTLEVTDVALAERFYTDALGLGRRVRVREGEAPTTGFRGFTLSLVVPGPTAVDRIVAAALEAGARPLKPAASSLWGYGGTVQAPDGTICTVAAASKKDDGSASREVAQLVLQLGVTDVAASKRFYRDRGVDVAKSFGRRYAELATSPVTVTLLRRTALARAAGVPADGDGAHRVAIGSDAGSFADPDGFVWERVAGER